VSVPYHAKHAHIICPNTPAGLSDSVLCQKTERHSSLQRSQLTSIFQFSESHCLYSSNLELEHTKKCAEKTGIYLGHINLKFV